MRIGLIIIAVILLALLTRLAFVIVPASGVLADLQPVLTDRCEALVVAPGTEDITIHHDAGLAFISTDDRRNGARGAIYALSLDGSQTLREVSGGMPDPFHPHGISLWTGQDGSKRLFVVNHRTPHDHTIEIFDIDSDGALSLAETVTHAVLTSPNDVLAVGPRQFYATNDRAYPTGIMSNLEAYLGLPLASVSYFNGESGRIVADGLAYANGINMSADGGMVYVAEILGRGVRIYDRDVQSGGLRRTRDVSVPTAPDNIEIGEDGALWIGGHPRVFDFVTHSKDENHSAPSHVIRVDPNTGDVTTVLMSLDGELNASSVAAVTENMLLVGAVFDDRILICPRE